MLLSAANRRIVRRSLVSSFPFLHALIRGRNKRQRQSDVGCVAEILEDRTLLSASIPLDSINWTQIGPEPILNGQTPGNEPVSGRIAAIAAHPSDADIIYIGAAGGGVWKTIDAGTSWIPLTDDQQTQFIGAIALAPSNPNIIYAGTGEASNSALSFYGRGVLKSTDAGNSWTLLTGNAGVDEFDRRAISKIVVHPTDPNTVFVAIAESQVNGLSGNTGIWRSTDGGTTWTNTTTAISTTSSFSDLVMDPSDPQTLYAAVGTVAGSASDGIYKTTDGGGSWNFSGDFPSGAADANVGRIKLAISTSSPQTLYASIVNDNDATPDGDGMLYMMMKTTNGGTNWNQLAATPNYSGTIGWYSSTLAVDPSNANIVYAGGLNIVQTTDGGTNWSNIGTGIDGDGVHVDHHGIGFDANGKLLDGNDGGIWRLDDPSLVTLDWTQLNGNLSITQFIGIAMHPTDADIAYGGTQDNGTNKFQDNVLWDHIAGGDGGFARVDTANPDTVYHTFQQNGAGGTAGTGFLERSDDGGATWASKTSGINAADSSNFYMHYVIDPVDPLRLVLGTDRVYETHDRADNWTALSAPNTNGWAGSANVDVVAVAPSVHNTIYASAGGHIFVTFDHGTNWNHRDTSDHDRFRDIQVDPSDNMVAYAVRDRFGGGHVWMTTDGGQNWTDISGNLPNLPTYSIEIDQSSICDVLYVGNDDGVYMSEHAGGSWTRFGDQLPNVQVRDLELIDGLGILAAGTHGRGVWEILIDPLTNTDPFEPNDVLADATILGSLQKITLRDLTIESDTDVDFFKYTAQDTGKLIVNIFFASSCGDLSLRVRDARGNVIATATQDNVTPGLDISGFVIPVVSQEEYFIEILGTDGSTNFYDLEIENFPAPVPSGVHLDPASDTGMMNNDNNTADNTPRFIIQADLSDFDAMGIDILSMIEANAMLAGFGTTPGAAVEVYITNSTTGFSARGFADSIGASTLLFDFTANPSLFDGVYFVSAAVRIFDGQRNAINNPDPATGRSQLSEPLWMTIDTLPPFVFGMTLPDMLASSDTGMFDDDNVTSKMSPAFDGLGPANTKVRVRANGVVVGQGVVNSDSSDGVPGDGLGHWEVTVEPLDDGIYEITAEFEDAAGNIFSTTELVDDQQEPLEQLVIEIDTITPNTPLLDLLAADDSGRSNEDNITNDQTPRLDSVVDDPNGPDVSAMFPNGHLFNDIVKYRIFDRIDTLPEALIFNQAALTTNGGYLNTVALINLDGMHGLKLEVEDRAGNLSHDFLLEILLDRVAPDNPTIVIDPATSDSGVPGYPDTIADRITNDTDTGFAGQAEANAIVRMWADGVSPFALPIAAADNDVFQGLMVAVPLDGNQAFPLGQWNLAGQFDLNDPNFFPILDGQRQISVTAEDVAGNESSRQTPGQLDIFIDTQGPRVFDPDGVGAQQAIQVITGGVANPTFDLFDIKPTLGPTPRTDGLLINIIDLPDRVAAFLYDALQEGVPSHAEKPGHYQLTGDTVGNVAIWRIQVVNAPAVAGNPATATIQLDFFEPLQDDRYTLTLRDTLTDPAGNALDGESNANEPNDGPTFPSGDLTPGGDFVARFTIDSRAEIGTWGQAGIFIDANGNYLFDPPVAGGINHDVSRDLVFNIGIQSDQIFAGQFKPAGAAAVNGYDRIGAYGLIGGTYRFLLDFNDNGRIDAGETITSNVQVSAFPISGNFDGNALNGDEIGLFDGATWYFDTTGDNLLDTTIGGGLRGLPIVGDFDGDGLVDLGTHIASSNAFFFSLSSGGGSLAGGNSNTTDTFVWGFPGVLERPFAGGDFNLDGIDDFGLTTPSQDGTDGELEWYIIVSDRLPGFPGGGGGGLGGGAGGGAIAGIFDDFTPTPLGNDIFTLYNGIIAAPVVGNFDPPNSLTSTTEFEPLASTTDTTPTLRWNDVGGASEYEVLLYNVDAGQQVAHAIVEDNSFTPTLEANVNYQSFVRPVNNYDQAGSWSSPYYFSIDGVSAPAVTSPVGSTDDATPTIAWTTSDGATSYNLLVYSLLTGQEVIHSFGESTTSFTPTAPLPGVGEYQVFVQASDANGTSNWSAAHVFELTAGVASLPGAPSVTSPTGTMSDSTPTVVWTAGVDADSYDMLVYNVGTGQEVANETGLAGTSFTLVTPLGVSGTHQIYMRSVNDVGTSGWNGPFTFDLALEGNAAPSAPTLLSPLVLTDDFTPTFDWTASDRADSYELLVYHIETGQQVFWQNNLTTTSYTPSSSLSGAGHYQVFLRATNGFGTSAWSTPSTFELVASLDDLRVWTLESQDVVQPVVDENADVTAEVFTNETTSEETANATETESTTELDAVMAEWSNTDWWQEPSTVA